MIVQGQHTGLGFADSGDYYDNYLSDYGGWGGGYDFFDYDWGWGGGGGYDYWSNFDPVTGDYLPTYGNTEGDYSPSGYSGDDWWKNLIGGDDYWSNFDPVTGDWINLSDYQTLATSTTSEPGLLPTGPSNWWDFLEPFLPSINSAGPANDYDTPPAPEGSQTRLPGYCPGGTYHPRWDPFACVPYPPNDPRSRQSQQQKQTPGGQQAQKPQQQQPCPKGQVRNPNTGKCVVIPQCPPPAQFNLQTGKCEKPKAGGAGSSCNWLCWLLIIGAGVVITKAATDSDAAPAKRRRK